MVSRILDGPIGEEIRKLDKALEDDELFWNDSIEKRLVAYIRSERSRLQFIRLQRARDDEILKGG